MQQILFGGARFNSVAGDFGLLILRVFAGCSLALAHGLGKLPPSEAFVTRVASFGVPGEIAWLSGLTEVCGGFLLAAGLFTRPVALAIAGNMSVAGFVAHAADPYGRKELAFLFLATAMMFLFAGGGRFSVDRLIKR